MFEVHKEESIFLSYIIAKIRTLQGRCHLESDLLSEARKKLNEAINSLSYYFPQHKFSINVKSTIQLELLRWKLICPKPWKIDTADELTTNYIEQLATCLALMFEVFRVKIDCFAKIFEFNKIIDYLKKKNKTNYFISYLSFLLFVILKLILC